MMSTSNKPRQASDLPSSVWLSLGLLKGRFLRKILSGMVQMKILYTHTNMRTKTLIH